MISARGGSPENGRWEETGNHIVTDTFKKLRILNLYENA